MDPITASIVGALMAGVLSGFTEIGKTAITDAYTKLKHLLNKKFVASSGVMQAIAQLESKPDSHSHQGVLHAKLAAVNALQDADVLAAASYLQMQVQQQQTINLRSSTVQGSIYQVGRDHYNVQQAELIGPKTISRVVRIFFIIQLIFWGVVVIAGGVSSLVFFVILAFTDSAQLWGWNQLAARPEGVIGAVLSIIGLTIGIAMVIGAIKLIRSLKRI